MVPFEIFRELHTKIRMGFAHLKSRTIRQVVLVYGRDRLLVGDMQRFDGLKSSFHIVDQRATILDKTRWENRIHRYKMVIPLFVCVVKD